MGHQFNQSIDVMQVIQDAVNIEKAHPLIRKIDSAIESILLQHEGVKRFVELIFSQKARLPGSGLKEYINAIYSQCSVMQRKTIDNQLEKANSLEEEKVVFLRQFAIDELRGLIASLECQKDGVDHNQHLNNILIDTQNSVMSKLKYSRVTRFIATAAEKSKPRCARSATFMPTIIKISRISSYAETIIQDESFLSKLDNCLTSDDLLDQGKIKQLSGLISQHVEKELSFNDDHYTQINDKGLTLLKEVILSEFAQPIVSSNDSFWFKPNGDHASSGLDGLSNLFRKNFNA